MTDDTAAIKYEGVTAHYIQELISISVLRLLLAPVAVWVVSRPR